jgi:hypothetical protein
VFQPGGVPRRDRHDMESRLQITFAITLKHHLADFNTRWAVVFPAHHKNVVKTIVGIDDFGDNLKESEVIKIAKSASIISNDVGKILEQKLGRRNSAAHPSGVKIEQLQAEEFIDDLVKNVVLKIV